MYQHLSMSEGMTERNKQTKRLRTGSVCLNYFCFKIIL